MNFGKIIYDLRKKKGITQEEMAAELGVTAAAVSKWEKGLSVPDADALVRIAELYEVTVGELLGAPPASEEATEPQPDMREVAEQLSRINEQLVIRNRRSSRIWKIVGGVLIGWMAIILIGLILSISAFSAYRYSDTITEETTILSEE